MHVFVIKLPYEIQCEVKLDPFLSGGGITRLQSKIHQATKKVAVKGKKNRDNIILSKDKPSRLDSTKTCFDYYHGEQNPWEAYRTLMHETIIRTEWVISCK